MIRGALILLIRGYQVLLSPALHFTAGCGCRFEPTCSHFAAEAVREHGAARGGWLALRRILKCGPWSRGGHDPVPRAARPHCRAVAG